MKSYENRKAFEYHARPRGLFRNFVVLIYLILKLRKLQTDNEGYIHATQMLTFANALNSIVAFFWLNYA